eukprot:1152876-Pelagomonas_calceolata.AAC.2
MSRDHHMMCLPQKVGAKIRAGGWTMLVEVPTKGCLTQQENTRTHICRAQAKVAKESYLLVVEGGGASATKLGDRGLKTKWV